jgi:predicted DNA-binding transcriptional regulator AlpA
LTREDVALRLATSVKTVDRMTGRGELPPPLKVGRLVRWRPEQIEAFLAGAAAEAAQRHGRRPRLRPRRHAVRVAGGGLRADV